MIAFPCVFEAFSCTRGSWPSGWAARAGQGADSLLSKRPRGRLSAGGRGNDRGLGAGLGLECALSWNCVVGLGGGISQAALCFDLHGSSWAALAEQASVFIVFPLVFQYFPDSSGTWEEPMPQCRLELWFRASGLEGRCCYRFGSASQSRGARAGGRAAAQMSMALPADFVAPPNFIGFA